MSIRFNNETERLLAEQAVLGYREVLKAAAEAEHGQGMAMMERATLAAGRRQMRSMLEHAASAHPEAQKGGPARNPAHAVGSDVSSDTPARPL